MMGLETPIVLKLVAQLPEPRVATAAFLLVMAVAIFIEGPVIDLLSTSTALAKSRADYAAIRRFTLVLMAWVVGLHALVVLTPVYGAIVEGLLGTPEVVANAAREALVWMIPWSGFIGWRRFRHGVLIRAGATRVIGFGTVLRALTMGASGAALLHWSELSGLSIAGAALLLSAGLESVYIHFVSAEAVAALPESDSPPPSLGHLSRFHFPLTGSTLVMLTVPGLLTAAINRAPEPVLSLAGWQVAGSITLMLRIVMFALPEVTIALGKTPEDLRRLAKFCVGTGALVSLLAAGLRLSGADAWFLQSVLEADAAVVGAAKIALAIAIPLPFLTAASAFLRGVLTSRGQTLARLTAILVSLVATVAGLAAATALGWSGVAVAGTGVLIGALAEGLTMAVLWRRGP